MFDFDATLPLMAVQFLILTFLLNQIFYKPLGQAIDSRAEYIRKNKADAKERLSKAKELAAQAPGPFQSFEPALSTSS